MLNGDPENSLKIELGLENNYAGYLKPRSKRGYKFTIWGIVEN